MESTIIRFDIVQPINSKHRVYDKAHITYSLNSFTGRLAVLNFRNNNFIKSVVNGSTFCIGLFNSRFEASTMLLTMYASHGSDTPVVV